MCPCPRYQDTAHPDPGTRGVRGTGEGLQADGDTFTRSLLCARHCLIQASCGSTAFGIITSSACTGTFYLLLQPAEVPLLNKGLWDCDPQKPRLAECGLMKRDAGYIVNGVLGGCWAYVACPLMDLMYGAEDSPSGF